MERVNINYGSELVDIIEVPNTDLGIKELQKRFFDWLFDKGNDHKYWIIEHGEKIGCAYETDAFIEWLNSNIFTGTDKVKLVQKNVKAYNPSDLWLEF